MSHHSTCGIKPSTSSLLPFVLLLYILLNKLNKSKCKKEGGRQGRKDGRKEGRADGGEEKESIITYLQLQNTRSFAKQKIFMRHSQQYLNLSELIWWESLM